jgi:hypothetical protein
MFHWRGKGGAANTRRAVNWCGRRSTAGRLDARYRLPGTACPRRRSRAFSTESHRRGHFAGICRLRDYSALRASPLRGRPAGDQRRCATLSNPACLSVGGSNRWR